MPAPRDPATLLAAARLYYQQDRSQAEIAATLGTSRSNVSRMLTEAQRQGIVEIRINDPEGRVHELEDELRTTFGLSEVRVAHTRNVPGLRVEDAVGTQAARLLLDELKDSMTVAMSWGHALQSMVYATTADHEHHRVTLVQLVGGLSSISNEISGQELVRELAVRLGAEYRFLHAPATLESSTSRDALLAEPSITDALDDAKSADIAFIGVGTPTHGSSSAILDSLSLSPAERDEFWSHEPVGDVAARYYNAQGTPIRGGVDDRVLGISLEDLLEIPNVVGVASGRAKAPGVLGALRGRIIDSLVCDEALARSVLSAAGSGSTHGGN
ncbi:MarR family transcriptional regulator [Nocardioides oleivorans]|uniref:MarR family transcriptional regulator n=1 Tax=Nocardioides oleivorans TaxID=273676 RepID=A0A4Q2RW59_9ACTN|nr:sugar-binding domain-containing protein [Nocardioides oleivorans]RYB93441.1 MarR family transcriptional regulator [Nocardioides oleivorans]